MITYYYFKQSDYDLLVNGYDFGVNSPVFVNVESKHYISKTNWDLWISSKPNHDYVLSIFSDCANIQEFVDNKFESLNQSEYEAHIADLSTDYNAFVEKERELCGLVSIEMAVVLNEKIRTGEMTFLQGLEIQDLFGKQSPITYNDIEDISSGSIVPVSAIHTSSSITTHLSIFECLEQMKSLGAAYERLRNTPVNSSIGFTQEIKDSFLSMIKKQRMALNA